MKSENNKKVNMLDLASKKTWNISFGDAEVYLVIWIKELMTFTSEFFLGH